MRFAGVCIVVLAWAVLAGCKGKSDAAGTAAPDPAALKAQQELISKREALLAQAQELKGKSEALDVQIKEIEAKGGDASAQKQQKAEVDSQLKSHNTDFDAISTKLDQIQATGDQSARLAARELEVARREKQAADREAHAAQREKEAAQRENDAAQRWKDSCNVGGGAPVFITQQAPKGTNYTRKEIEPLLTQARQGMQKRGILVADLPGHAQGLEAEATKAMGDGDWGKAYLAAAQLAATVQAIKIDRPFVMAKYNRLNSRVTGAKLDAGVTQQLTDGMKDVLQRYGDGDFAGANHKLNALHQLLR